MDTAEEVIEEIKPFAGANGSCSDTVAFDFVNKGRRLLWNKTDYPETLDYLAVCCAGNCFTMPSAYKQIRLAWLDKAPISIGNEWYMSVPQVGLPPVEDSCHRRLIQSGGFHVTFQDYTDAPFQVGIQAESSMDAGGSITFFGNDLYDTSKKESLQIASPPERSLSANFYKSVTAVIKPRTKGRIRLYAVDRANNQFLLLAIYQPYDKNPQFRRYHISGGKNEKTLTLCAKKTYYDLVDQQELVEFPTEALKFAVMALVAQRDRDLKAYQDNLMFAMAELAKEMSDATPPTASPLRLFHTNHPENLIHY